MRCLVFILSLALGSQIRAQDITIDDLELHAPAANCTSVKNQYLSSTCWSFASLSFLESEMLKNGKGTIDLSEMFVARYSYLRKIDRHLKLKGTNFFTPGGQFHDVAWVFKNHGMVPESAYPGKPGSQLHHNHSELDTAISRFVRKLIAENVTTMNQEQSAYINYLLDTHLGPVPETFTYEGLTYTPSSFPSRVMEIEPDDYVEITSYSHHPYYSKYVLEDKHNWTGDAYHNIPLIDLITITNEALQSGYTIGWDGDADDPEFRFYDGIAFMQDTSMDLKASRQTAFENKSTLLNHMMEVVATTKDKYGKLWYYVKNSWGESNSLGGFLFMNDTYFKLRTVAIFVNKKAIPMVMRAKMGL